MAQRLIVEGNDAIALAQLCKRCGLQPPSGYEQPAKFKKEFVTIGEGYNGALQQLKLSLTEPDLTNIGIILDANELGATARWQSIRAILADEYEPATLDDVDVQAGAKIIREPGMPTVSIWIMPDNASVGYLEHFLSDLIPSGNALWPLALTTIDIVMSQPDIELGPTKRQKALLHTWLAWQPEPGKPFGQAIQANYFDHKAPAVQPFLDWFAATFQLSA